MSIGDNLKRIRIENGFTQDKLAKSVNVARFRIIHLLIRYERTRSDLPPPEKDGNEASRPYSRQGIYGVQDRTRRGRNQSAY